MQNKFFVKACWDEEAGVYYSESDIIGLHIEADTIEAFEEAMDDAVPELIFANHISQHISAMPAISLQDLIPAVLWQRPPAPEAVCAE